jgi:sirohydrochlorin cobaltochelatase
LAVNDPAIILAAYGTSTRGIETYRSMDTWFVRRFKDHQILWAFTSGALLAASQPRIRDKVISLEDAIERVTETDVNACVVQSLHVWPAKEYHGIMETLEKSKAVLKIALGGPLILDPSDFDPVLDILSPDLTHGSREGVVLIAHGTDHSNVSLYNAFGETVRERFGETVWVELVREPGSGAHLRQRATRLGVGSIRFVPFMMVAGRHVLRDVMGDHEGSWRSQLLSVGVESCCQAPALGLRSGVLERFCKRIEAALKGMEGTRRDGGGEK